MMKRIQRIQLMKVKKTIPVIKKTKTRVQSHPTTTRKKRIRMVEKKVKKRHPMMRCLMRSGRHGGKRRRSKGRKSLTPELLLILVMTLTPIPREEPHALQTRAAHRGQKAKVIIEELLMTILFHYLVSTMHQSTWASHLSLMGPDTINGRQRCTAT